MVNRDQVISAFEAALKTITVANGFETDLGKLVMYHEGTQEHDQMAHLVFGDFAESYNVIGNGRGVECTLGVEVQANMFAQYVANGTGGQTMESRGALANKALRDLLRMWRRNPSLGLHGVFVRPVNSDLYVDGIGHNVAVRFMTFELKYRTDLTNI